MLETQDRRQTRHSKSSLNAVPNVEQEHLASNRIRQIRIYKRQTDTGGWSQGMKLAEEKK